MPLPPPPLLRCPRCARPFPDAAATSVSVTCTTGHRFELNKRGYLALLSPGAHLPPAPTPSALDALEARFSGREGAEFTEAIAAAAPHGKTIRLLDMGSDLGHAAEALLSAHEAWTAVAVCSSPAAASRTLGRLPDVLLADPLRELPVEDGAVDLVLAVLAPTRPAEFHRVLAPGGVVLTALAPDDLSAEQLLDDTYPWFEHDQTRRLWLDDGEHSVVRLRRRRRMVTW